MTAKAKVDLDCGTIVSSLVSLEGVKASDRKVGDNISVLIKAQKGDIGQASRSAIQRLPPYGWSCGPLSPKAAPFPLKVLFDHNHFDAFKHFNISWPAVIILERNKFESAPCPA